MNGQWVPCVCNSSYSLIQILLKLYRHCDHALNICMWLGYTPQINFCHFSCNLNLAIFRTFSHLESELPVGGIVFYKHIFWFLKVLKNIPNCDIKHVQTSFKNTWYKYLVVNLVFSYLGFWRGNLFLISPFPDRCLLVPFSYN